MKHSGMHAGDLFVVMFRHQRASNAVWLRADFKLSFVCSFHFTLLLRVLHHGKSANSVRRYSVAMFVVHFATLSVSNVLSSRRIIKKL